MGWLGLMFTGTAARPVRPTTRSTLPSTAPSASPMATVTARHQQAATATAVAAPWTGPTPRRHPRNARGGPGRSSSPTCGTTRGVVWPETRRTSCGGASSAGWAGSPSARCGTQWPSSSATLPVTSLPAVCVRARACASLSLPRSVACHFSPLSLPLSLCRCLSLSVAVCRCLSLSVAVSLSLRGMASRDCVCSATPTLGHARGHHWVLVALTKIRPAT